MDSKTICEQIERAHECANTARITSEQADARAAAVRTECASLGAQFEVISRTAELARAEATVSAADAAVVRAQAQVNRVERSSKQATEKVAAAKQAFKLADEAAAAARNATQAVSTKNTQNAEDDEALIARAEANSLHSEADAARAESKVASANADIENSHLRIARAELDASKAKAAYAQAAALVFKLQLDAARINAQTTGKSAVQSVTASPVQSETNEPLSDVTESVSGNSGDDLSVVSPGTTPETKVTSVEFKQAVKAELAKNKLAPTLHSIADSHSPISTCDTKTTKNVSVIANSSIIASNDESKCSQTPQPEVKPGSIKATASASDQQINEPKMNATLKPKTQKSGTVAKPTVPKSKQNVTKNRNTTGTTKSTVRQTRRPASTGKVSGNPFQISGDYRNNAPNAQTGARANKSARNKTTGKEHTNNSMDPPSANRSRFNSKAFQPPTRKHQATGSYGDSVSTPAHNLCDTSTVNRIDKNLIPDEQRPSTLNAGASEFIPKTNSRGFKVVPIPTFGNVSTGSSAHKSFSATFANINTFTPSVRKGNANTYRNNPFLPVTQSNPPLNMHHPYNGFPHQNYAPPFGVMM